MHPVVSFVDGSGAWYWWYSPLAQDVEFVAMDQGVTSPRVCIDDRRPEFTGSSDVVLGYILNDRLKYRLQRDRYGVEYDVAPAPCGVLTKIGMSVGMRLQFAFGGATIS